MRKDEIIVFFSCTSAKAKHFPIDKTYSMIDYRPVALSVFPDVTSQVTRIDTERTTKMRQASHMDVVMGATLIALMQDFCSLQSQIGMQNVVFRLQ